MIENANLKRQLAAQQALPTPSPTLPPGARPEEIVFIIMTAFVRGFFPERAVALQRSWGHAFPRLLFVGVDTEVARAMLNENQCVIRDVAAPNEPGAPVHAEFTCFDDHARIKVVLLPPCTDDHHSPVGTSCKAQEGLLHVVKYEPEWFASAKWFSVCDDDVFLWRSQFLRWVGLIEGDPYNDSIALTPFGIEMHNLCHRVLDDRAALPKVPVPSMIGFVSKGLLVRQVPYLLNGSMVAISREFEELHDIAWGTLMFNLRPFVGVSIPFCDARTPLNCDKEKLFVHAIRVEQALKPNLTCPPQVVEEALPIFFENSFERGATPAPFHQRAPPITNQLWSKSQCVDFQPTAPTTTTAAATAANAEQIQ